MKRFISFLVIFTFFLSSYAQVTVKLGSVSNAEPGTYVNVPVILSGFEPGNPGMIGMELYFNFPSAVLQFDSVANASAYTPAGQWFYNAANGKLSANWLEGNLIPVNFPNNTALIEFVFFYNGGTADLTIDTLATAILDEFSGTFTIESFIHGKVTQGQGASTSTWNGNGNWNNASNWSNGIPGPGTDVIINEGNVEVEGSVALCNNLQINANCTVVINPGYSLTAAGNTNNLGSIILIGDLASTGSLKLEGTTNNQNNIHVKKLLTSTSTYQLASPVQDVTVANTQIEGDFKTFVESLNNWQTQSGAYGLNTGEGFELTPSNSDTLHLAGHYPSAAFTKNLSFTSQASADLEGWNLVGNPFTSAFNANDITGTSTFKAVYAWNGTRYLTWNGYTGNLVNGIIPALSSFFVKSAGSGASISIPKTACLHDFSYFNGQYSIPSNVLKLTLANFENESNFDETYIQFNPESTPNLDPNHDAFKLSNHVSFPELFSFSADNTALAINSFPFASSVELGFRAPAEGFYTISINSGYIGSGIALLKDKDLNVEKDLKTENYTFSTVAGEFNDRFELFLSGVGVEELTAPLINVWGNNQVAYIQNISGKQQTGLLSVYDLSGRQVHAESIDLQSSEVYSLPVKHGAYILNFEGKSAKQALKLIL